MDKITIIAVFATLDLSAGFFLSGDPINTVCPYKITFPLSPHYHGNQTVDIKIEDVPIVLEGIVLNTSRCRQDETLIEAPFKVDFVDGADHLASQMLTYSKKISPLWVSDESFEIPFDTSIYTSHIRLMHHVFPVTCTEFTAYGCPKSLMCPAHRDLCGSLGDCIGSGKCDCKKDTYGRFCNNTRDSIRIEFYEPIVIVGGKMLTSSGSFDIVGDVIVTNATGRTRRSSNHGHQNHHDSHHNVHLSGHGGSMTYSHSNGHGGDQHHQHTCLHNTNNGYSHTASVQFGHDHDHNHHTYLYTNHGHHHHGHGSSLHYHDHHLEMHHHHDSHDQPGHHHGGHHYHLSVPFSPKPNTVNHIVSTYSPHSGVGLYVNGQLQGSQVNPTVTPSSGPRTTTAPHTTPPPSTGPAPMCVGNCGHQTTNGPSNVNLSNMGLSSASVQALISNSQMGNLNLPLLLSLLLKTNNTSSALTTTPMPSTTSTTTTPTTTVTTTPSTVATKPSTTGMQPITAQSGSTVLTTASGLGPLCYQCSHHDKNDGECKHLQQCNQGELCAVFKDTQGFFHKCMKKQECDYGQTSATNECFYCCLGDRCNMDCPLSRYQKVTTPPPATTTASMCNDTPQCSQLQAAGYSVCTDATVAKSLCVSTCKKCPTG